MLFAFKVVVLIVQMLDEFELEPVVSPSAKMSVPVPLKVVAYPGEFEIAFVKVAVPFTTSLTAFARLKPPIVTLAPSEIVTSGLLEKASDPPIVPEPEMVSVPP